MCRKVLIRSALESSDPRASNGGSNFTFRHFGADMATFEVAGELRTSTDRQMKGFLVRHATLKAAMSAAKCRKMKFDPPLDAPGSGFSSARRINIVRQTLERVTTDL